MSALFKIVVVCMLWLPSHVVAEKLRIGVSIEPQKYLVERIGGEHVDITVMLRPGDSPEHFDPSPGQIQALANTSIYFPVGLEFEQGWLNGLVKENRHTHIVACCESVFVARNGELDRHGWVSVRNAGRLAKLIRDELILIDPTHAEDFEANYLALSSELAMLDREIVESLEQRRTDYFIVSHAALGHFAADYGLKQLALEEGGVEVGARSLVSLARKARNENITTLFTQQQHPSSSAITLAREIDAKLVEIDPLPEDYISGLREIARQLASATR